MNFRTYKDLNKTINENIHRIPKDVDLIVGIPRSGMMVASMLSLYLNLPLTDINSLINNTIFESGITKTKDSWIKNISDARKILVVEDSSISGNSLKKLREQLETYKYKDRIIVLTIYVTDLTKDLPDLYFEICNPPRAFEWNYLHIKRISNACVDIDGVLCVDPNEEENDDGEKYVNFLKTTSPRFIPTYPIGCLVTTRLEKYRHETEQWLQDNGIKYNELIMLDVATKEERQKLGNYGKFKAEVYKNKKNYDLFIESNYNQAVEIARISGKTVFCIENLEVINENTIIHIKNDIKSKLVILLTKIYRKIRIKKKN